MQRKETLSTAGAAEDIINFDALSQGEDFKVPIDSENALNAKIISSDNKDKKIVLTFPKTKTVKVGLPLLNDNGKIALTSKGLPILYKIRKMRIFDGYDTEIIDFPFKDWFNDSVTSAFLSPREARFLRMSDRLAFALFIETMENYPKINRLKTIAQIGWVKASFADSSKGIEGEGVKYAKSTFSKQENINRNYGMDEDYQKFQEAKKKKPWWKIW